MNGIVRWAVKHMAGINFLIVAIMIGGLASFFGMRRETFPEFQLEVVLVTVPCRDQETHEYLSRGERLYPDPTRAQRQGCAASALGGPFGGRSDFSVLS